MGKHKRDRQSQFMPQNAMYPPGMMGPNMMPPNMAPQNMMPPNMVPPNMMPPNMVPQNMMAPNMNNNGMNQPNMGGQPGQNTSTGNPLLDMLGNVDMTQLNSLLSSLTSNGVNLNKLNLGGLSGEENANQNNEDNTIQLLNAIRSFLPPQRANIIDKIIQMYNNGDFND